jgi:hypothetical protein
VGHRRHLRGDVVREAREDPGAEEGRASRSGGLFDPGLRFLAPGAAIREIARDDVEPGLSSRQISSSSGWFGV